MVFELDVGQVSVQQFVAAPNLLPLQYDHFHTLKPVGKPYVLKPQVYQIYILKARKVIVNFGA